MDSVGFLSTPIDVQVILYIRNHKAEIIKMRAGTSEFVPRDFGEHPIS
jgi:hypothetical protein